MSDPRFSRLKTDPRFRRPRRKENKVVVDSRFKSLFEEGAEKSLKDRKGKAKVKVDKYGRKISATQDRDNLRRFYRLEEDEDEPAPSTSNAPDYARGEGLVESSSEENDSEDELPDETIELGPTRASTSRHAPKVVDDLVDLDESAFADLDAQAEAYASKAAEDETEAAPGEQTRRLAVVNLDWDHVQAAHLYKIFASILSTSTSTVQRGKVLRVRVYPSEFGKKRMEREEVEGPPPEVFKKKSRKEEDEDEDEINEKNIFEEDEGNDYDDDALRTYQLERLRYYYAVVECDSPQTASYIYAELDGAELERSANVFDLSFIPDEMVFEGEYRDEAAAETALSSNKPLDFTTSALRHSKVTLTWDDDDPTRTQLTRRNLTRKEIDEADFKAYIASSSSESDSDQEGRKTDRDKLRALLLGGGEDRDDLPEGWGGIDEVPKGDMEITFMPGLTDRGKDKGDGEEETTLERYQRKQKEKKVRRKAEKEKSGGGKTEENDDDFFGDDSEADAEPTQTERKEKGKPKSSPQPSTTAAPKKPSTKEELSLLVAPSATTSGSELRHFDMKEVIKSEKGKKDKKKRKQKKGGDDEGEEKEDGAGFEIDVKDDRFKALHEEYEFAIDPSNPHFKQTKAMSALLFERSKRQKNSVGRDREDVVGTENRAEGREGSDIKKLVESVKRKSSSALGDNGGVGKRRKF